MEKQRLKSIFFILIPGILLFLWNPSALAQTHQIIDGDSTQTLNNKTLVAPGVQNPAFSGTSTGSITIPNLTAPSPVISNPAFSGTSTGNISITGLTASAPQINTPSFAGTSTGSFTIGGTTYLGIPTNPIQDIITKGPWLDVRSCGGINACITAIGATPASLFISTNTTLSSSAVVPSTLTLLFIGNGSITKGGASTLAINGSLSAFLLNQIFIGFNSGDVTFSASPGAVKEVYPQWWGAKCDKTITDDTVALNSAIATIKDLVFTGACMSTAEITLPVPYDGRKWKSVGTGLPGEPVQGGIWYNGATDPTKAVVKIVGHALGNTFDNVAFVAQKKAGFSFLVDPNASQIVVKLNTFRKIQFDTATVVNLNIGNRQGSGTTFDIDADGNTFYDCTFIAAPYNVWLDAQNLKGTSFYSPRFQYSQGGDNAITIKDVVQHVGSGTQIFNGYWSLKSNADATRADVEVNSGSFSILGGISEDAHVLRVVGDMTAYKNIGVKDLSVNRSGDPGVYSVWADSGNITLDNDDFATTDTNYRKIYVASKLTVNGVDLGYPGIYELPAPQNDVIDGITVGNLKAINQNPNMDVWSGTGVDTPPSGYTKLTGAGYTGTIQNGAGASYSPGNASTVVTVSVQGGAQGIGLTTTIPVTHIQGKILNFIVSGTLTGGYNATNNVTGSLVLNSSGGFGLQGGVWFSATRFIAYANHVVGASDTNAVLNFWITAVGTVNVESFVAFAGNQRIITLGGYGGVGGGEYQTIKLASGSATSLTTDTPKNITTYQITPGDWECWGVVDFNPAATTSVTQLYEGISATSAALGADDTFSFANWAGGSVLNVTQRRNVPRQRFSVGVTTNIYLVAQAQFSVSTMTAYGSLFCTKR